MANQKLDAIKSGVSALKNRAEDLQQALQKAELEKINLLNQLEEKHLEIAELKDRLSKRNIAQAVMSHGNGTTHPDTQEAKSKIAELMREIDRCIALLNV